jgi:hypothetical protein
MCFVRAHYLTNDCNSLLALALYYVESAGVKKRLKHIRGRKTDKNLAAAPVATAWLFCAA